MKSPAKHVVVVRSKADTQVFKDRQLCPVTFLCHFNFKRGIKREAAVEITIYSCYNKGDKRNQIVS